MKIKIFTLNKNEKIELSREELEELLHEAYLEGKEESAKDSSPSVPSYVYPSCINCPYFPVLYNTAPITCLTEDNTTQIDGQLSLKDLKLEV